MAKKRRRDDGPWRRACLAKRGAYCRACGEANDLQVDHVLPRSQGGQSDVENGLVLCGPWSKASPHQGGCHQAKTDKRMTIEYDWLDPDQIEYLAEHGWVEWDEDGEPTGRGYRGFAPRRERKATDGR